MAIPLLSALRVFPEQIQAREVLSLLVYMETDLVDKFLHQIDTPAAALLAGGQLRGDIGYRRRRKTFAKVRDFYE
jgi:hypothetical protein